MTSSTVDAVLAALTRPGIPAREAATRLPDEPGLYAVWGTLQAWQQLGLGEPGARPLYVGKAEGSLRRRDGRTHFRAGTTGRSTFRRSLAALLRQDLQLIARPRNPNRGDRLASYGLAPESEQRLQDWVERQLTISVWVADPVGVALAPLEQAVIGWWPAPPPLNLKDLGGRPSPAAARIRTARARMAADAARWRA